MPFSGEMLVALNGEYGAFYDIVKIKRNGSTIRDVPKSVERVSMEESSSTNSIRDNAKNVKGNGQNSDKRFSLMNNGIIAIELNTVKDPKTLNIILWCRRSPQKTTICAIPCRNAPIASNT